MEQDLIGPAIDKFLKADETSCPVCGGGKFSHEEFCRDCAEHKKRVTEARRAAARRRAFGRVF